MSLSTQARWLAERAGVYQTSDRVVHVRGDDARSWLNGQISNDVRTLAGDEGRYAVTLTVKGRVVSDLWAVDEPPGMALILPEVALASALERFDKHIIMEDVELEPDPAIRVVTVQGPLAAEVVSVLPPEVRRVACARLGSSGFDCWLPQASEGLRDALVRRAEELGGGAIDDAGWADAHVRLAVPRIAVDFGPESYPQEAGIGARALSFSKGCYLGQEVVYMLENRGQAARKLVQLASVSPLAAGAQVLDESGKRVGEITSVATREADEPHTLALASVKRSAAAPGQTVWVDGSRCDVRHVVGAG